MNVSLPRVALARLFDRIAGGPGSFRATESFPSRSPLRIIVLSPGCIPTTDLYLRGRLENEFDGDVRYVDTLRNAPGFAGLADDTLFVVVRSAPLQWLRWLSRMASRSAGIIYLMDDDMPSALRSPELPFIYALKTAYRYALTSRYIGRHCSETWLSTHELAHRYPWGATRLVRPGNVFPRSGMGRDPVYFYHATRSHRWDIEWLVPVVAAVQRSVRDAWFEVIGGGDVRRLFRGVPRVHVLPPMTWTDYRSYVETRSYQVGLAPCRDTAFNRARSFGKVFEITAMGAAGVYANGCSYAQAVAHGRTGLLCRNDPDAWTAAILLLLEDHDLRRTLFRAARDWCGKHKMPA